ncbi:MAG: hypothetical protein NUV67_05095 [archaeon]|nr:hypothetical protein [archaeon]
MAQTLRVFAVLIAVLAIAAILFVPSGGASESGLIVLMQDRQTLDSYFVGGKLRQETVDEINSNIDNVPDQLFELFGNNKINIQMEFNDKEKREYYAQTGKNRLESLYLGNRNTADIEVRIKESTLDKIVLSNEPFAEFLNAMNSGEIEYRGLNFEGNVKGATVGITTQILGVAKSVLGFFGSFFG